MWASLCSCCQKNPNKKDKKKGREAPEELGIEESPPKKTFAFSRKGYGKKKTECQDTFCIMENFYKDMTYLAVYDGHGGNGKVASELANSTIKNYLEENKEVLYNLDGEDEVSNFFKKLFKMVQDKYKSEKVDYQLSGTCCVAVLIKEGFAYTANLGDSRAVIGSCSEEELCALEISIDHKPTREGEKERILAAGGKIERSMVDDKEVGPFRVWKAEDDVPGIAISRSFGDLIAHKIGVVADPEVSAKELDSDDKFIVMGSDGVWDVMSSAEAVGFVLSLQENEQVQAAERLVGECGERWDLLNEIKRKQAQIMLENSDSKKGAAERKNEIERNIVCDDITVAIHFLSWPE